MIKADLQASDTFGGVEPGGWQSQSKQASHQLVWPEGDEDPTRRQRREGRIHGSRVRGVGVGGGREHEQTR